MTRDQRPHREHDRIALGVCRTPVDEGADTRIATIMNEVSAGDSVSRKRVRLSYVHEVFLHIVQTRG